MNPGHLSPRRRAPWLVVTLILALCLTSCADEPAPRPSPTAAFSSEEEAFAAAEEVYRQYNRSFNAIDLADPATFEAAFEFTAGDYEEVERRALSEMHAEGYIRGGEIVIVSFTPVELNGGEIRAHVCTDVSGSMISDKNGTSLVPAHRPDRVALDLTFTIDDASLFLTDAETVADTTC